MNTSWPTLTSEVYGCQKCRLCQTRTNVVLGEGDLHAPLMFIGEGPGQQEDLSGRPFVGAAGQLLDQMLAAIGLTRGQPTSATSSSAARRRTACRRRTSAPRA